MTLHKKDFETLAAVVRTLRYEDRGPTCSMLVQWLETKNEKFDKAKFIKACLGSAY